MPVEAITKRFGIPTSVRDVPVGWTHVSRDPDINHNVPSQIVTRVKKNRIVRRRLMAPVREGVVSPEFFQRAKEVYKFNRGVDLELPSDTTGETVQLRYRPS